MKAENLEGELGDCFLQGGLEMGVAPEMVYPRSDATDVGVYCCKMDLTPKSNTPVTKGREECRTSPGIHFIFGGERDAGRIRLLPRYEAGDCGYESE